MLPTIIGLVLFILLIVLLGYIFTATIIEVVLNGVLIYLILLRAWTELVRKARTKEYIIGAVAALLICFIRGNVVPQLWTMTTFLAITFIVAEIAHLFFIKRKKK
jgi:hypothetical protein